MFNRKKDQQKHEALIMCVGRIEMDEDDKWHSILRVGPFDTREEAENDCKLQIQKLEMFMMMHGVQSID